MNFIEALRQYVNGTIEVTNQFHAFVLAVYNLIAAAGKEKLPMCTHLAIHAKSWRVRKKNMIRIKRLLESEAD